ncbi:MAG: 2-oxoacid:ferredoxin oxidoreductase subunit gamma, partial [Candidatus Rokubacteria bacterium]|nr:2-oxoacid:ferredoxin oxidoreductase subunit gamma [Candidatus Rokubacteria bacterium]
LAQLGRGRAGKGVPPNMAALGALVALTDLVPLPALVETAMARVPRGTEGPNRQALEAGYAAARGTK